MTATILPGAYAPALAEDLASLSVQILDNPSDVALNLRYAALAEMEGKPRFALAAYERVLAVDPRNAMALAGLKRVRLALEPNLTQFASGVGIAYETNPPAPAMTGRQPEAQAFYDFAIKDERTWGQRRWRSTVDVLEQYHFRLSNLNYAYIGSLTGPLIDLGPNTRLHVAAGGSVAMLAKQLFYWQTVGALTFEIGAHGATQTVRLRGGYREYGPDYVTHQGFFGDVTGGFVLSRLSTGRALIFSPWARYSGIGGTAFDFLLNEEVAPGRYVEAGGKAEVQQQVNRWLTLAANISASGRDYLVDTAPATTTHRLDFIVSPGASIILPRVIRGDTDVRLDYTFIMGNSNDNTHDFHDQRVSVRVGSHF